jgi:hypothetical protein
MLGPGKSASEAMRKTMPLQQTGFLSTATQLRPVIAQVTIDVPENKRKKIKPFTQQT